MRAVTFPIDTTKTRLQIQGQMMKEALKENKYTGMLDAFTKIVSEEGFFRLYRGLVTLSLSLLMVMIIMGDEWNEWMMMNAAA